MRIFVCVHCRFMFMRSAEPQSCPLCGRTLIREADPREAEQFQKSGSKIEPTKKKE